MLTGRSVKKYALCFRLFFRLIYIFIRLLIFKASAPRGLCGKVFFATQTWYTIKNHPRLTFDWVPRKRRFYVAT
jgi:hypothetical protein